MFEELGDRLLHVHIRVTLALNFCWGEAESKSTRHPLFVKKLFALGNMLQEHYTAALRINGLRGLRLFVRPIDASDATEVHAFLERQHEPSATPGEGARPYTETAPACGLLGKLLGEIVAVVALDLTSDAVRIDDVIVARDLRKKRIGKAMMREVEQLAVKMDRNRIIVEDARDADEFFRRVGFVSEGERWVRVVS